MFTANDESSRYPRCPRVEMTPFATSSSNRTPYRGTARVEAERYTKNNIPTMRKIVTIVMSFKLELAIVSVSEASGAADIDLEPGRRRVLGDGIPNGTHRLIRLHLADIARETQQHVRGLAVDALRPGRGDRLPPQIHDVLHMLGVLLEAAHQIVVIPMVPVVQRSVGFEHDHGQAGGIGLVELLTDVQQRPLRRRVVRDLRPREFFCDSLYLRHEGVRRDRQKPPKDDDRYRQDTNRPGDERPFRPTLVRAMLAHADFTMQKTCAS